MTQATIAAAVADRRKELSEAPPDKRMDTFTREQAELSSLVPEGTMAIGEQLPDAHLLDVRGRETTLRAAIGQRPAVLVFYRGAWCPYCNIALRTYQRELVDELAERAVTLIAISPQKPDGSLTMQELNELRFTVLSDPENTLAGAAGILTAPSEEARAAQLELGLDLEAVNASGTVTLPMPTTVIVDPDLTVRWLDVHPDYSTRTEPDEILHALAVINQ
jgi:peroxiredoxin